MLINFLILFAISLFSGAEVSDDEVLIDTVYDEYIKSARLFPNMDVLNREHLPPAIPLNQQGRLLFVFDDLFNETQNFEVKFIHCNADWTKSPLFPLDYIEGYNEFPVINYDYSFNTLVNYIHYYFELPRFKIPGNYVLQLYREGEEEEILVQKRFMIFDNQVRLIDSFDRPGLTTITRMNQEISFTLDYERTNFRDPHRNISVTIRQNQRWDNIIENLQPIFIKEDIKQMDYNYFAGENEFSGGNQFRFFDLRSLQYFGQNVETVRWQRRPPLAYIQIDKPRTGLAYSIYQDFNGKYIVTHPNESDYAEVVFTLESEKYKGDVYLAGELTNWELKDEYKMFFDLEKEIYTNTLFLKQGYYDYQYLLVNEDQGLNYIEGDHFQTENEYEVLVYYKSVRLNTDLLIGYFVQNTRP